MGLGIPLSSCSVCNLVSDGCSRGPSVLILKWPGQVATCPALQGRGLVLEEVNVKCFKQITSGEERQRSQQAQSCGTAACFPVTERTSPPAVQEGEGGCSSNNCPPPQTHTDALPPPMTEMVLPSFLFRSHYLPLHTDADTAGKGAHDHAGCAVPGRV